MIDYHLVALGAHLIGFALGVGGATISDLMFLKALKQKKLSIEHYNFLKLLSKVIWIGLGLLIVSGLVIFYLIYSEQGSLPMLGSPRWQMKLSLVVVILINGLVFKNKVFPFLNQLIGNQLSMDNMGRKVWALAISGTISILSWYSILVISLLPRTVRPHLLIFIGIYLILLVLGIIIAKNKITKTLSSP